MRMSVGDLSWPKLGMHGANRDRFEACKNTNMVCLSRAVHILSSELLARLFENACVVIEDVENEAPLTAKTCRGFSQPINSGGDFVESTQISGSHKN
jgi:hypothetical protein